MQDGCVTIDHVLLRACVALQLAIDDCSVTWAVAFKQYFLKMRGLGNVCNILDVV